MPCSSGDAAGDGLAPEPEQSRTESGGYEVVVRQARVGNTYSPKGDLSLWISCASHESFLVNRVSPAPGTEQDLGPIELQPLSVRAIRVVERDSGAPIAGARVSARRLEPEADLEDRLGNLEASRVPFVPIEWTRETDQNGRCVSPFPGTDPIRFLVEHDDRAPLVRVLEPGALPDEIVLGLAPGATVDVLCLDRRTGAPFAGVLVAHHAGALEPKNHWDEHARRVSQPLTDPRGSVVLAGLSSGHHCFWMPELGSDRVEVDLTEDERRTVVLHPEERVHLSGTVRERGVPLAGAGLGIAGSQAWSDLEGRYSLPNLPVGDGTIVVRHPRMGFLGLVSVELAPPATGLDLDLAPVHLRGVVRDLAGAPLMGGQVGLTGRGEDGRHAELALGWSTPWRARTDENGRFSIGHVLPREDLGLQAKKEGYSTRFLSPLAFVESEALDVEIVLAAAALLRVRVLGSDPSSDPVLWARWLGDGGSASDEQLRQGLTGGTVRFTRLFAGRWRIELHSGWFDGTTEPIAFDEVELVVGENPDLTLSVR